MRGWELVKAVNFILSVRCSGVWRRWGGGVLYSFTFLISLKDPSGYNVEKDKRIRIEAEKPLRWYCNSSRWRGWWFALKCKDGKSMLRTWIHKVRNASFPEWKQQVHGH